MFLFDEFFMSKIVFLLEDNLQWFKINIKFAYPEIIEKLYNWQQVSYNYRTLYNRRSGNVKQ